ncbi:MAG: GIY-YIG nuclease family protein [Cytophagales bacterium]
MMPVLNKFYVYILTTKNNRVLYTGFTNDLHRRIYEHKNFLYENSFTAKYKISKLVYFEEFDDADQAKHREWLIKRYKRKWKLNLINSINPNWEDLYNTL